LRRLWLWWSLSFWLLGCHHDLIVLSWELWLLLLLHEHLLLLRCHPLGKLAVLAVDLLLELLLVAELLLE